LKHAGKILRVFECTLHTVQLDENVLDPEMFLHFIKLSILWLSSARGFQPHHLHVTCDAEEILSPVGLRK